MDIDKAKELRAILLKYNGVPSQKEDRSAYQNITYYIKKYSEEPEIKALIDEFHLSVRKYNKDKKNQVAEIKAILEERKAMPHSSQEKELYGIVKDFFKKYKDDPEIEKLKYQYAGPSCFPLPNSVTGKKQTQWDYSGICKHRNESLAFEYVEYVWEKFGILPEENTRPMREVREKIHDYCRSNGSKSSQEEIDNLFTFSKLMDKYECSDKCLCNIHHCPEFDSPEVQQRVRNLVIENGSCAIKYIAEMAIPGISLPVEFVYYYYWKCAYDKEDYWTIRPLGFTYVLGKNEDYGQYFVRVHFRDYHKCDVDTIRKSAKANYRNWLENPPKTIEEWKYFGQWGLFVHDYGYKAGSELQLLCDDWSETIIEHALKTSERYFYFYPRYKYCDYLLFLLENNFKLYKSQVINWLSDSNFEGLKWIPEEQKLEQKVKTLLERKGIDLKNLPRY